LAETSSEEEEDEEEDENPEPLVKKRNCRKCNLPWNVNHTKKQCPAEYKKDSDAGLLVDAEIVSISERFYWRDGINPFNDGTSYFYRVEWSVPGLREFVPFDCLLSKCSKELLDSFLSRCT